MNARSPRVKAKAKGRRTIDYATTVASQATFPEIAPIRQKGKEKAKQPKVGIMEERLHGRNLVTA